MRVGGGGAATVTGTPGQENLLAGDKKNALWNMTWFCF